MASSGILFEPGDFEQNLEQFDDHVLESVETVLEFYRDRAVTQMRQNASWTDRTGNARNGLAGDVTSDSSGGVLVLYHTVPYGIWLEIRWSGRYAIVGPTMNEIGPKIMSMIAQLVASSRGV